MGFSLDAFSTLASGAMSIFGGVMGDLSKRRQIHDEEQVLNLRNEIQQIQEQNEIFQHNIQASRILGMLKVNANAAGIIGGESEKNENETQADILGRQGFVLERNLQNTKRMYKFEHDALREGAKASELESITNIIGSGINTALSMRQVSAMNKQSEFLKAGFFKGGSSLDAPNVSSMTGADMQLGAVQLGGFKFGSSIKT